MKVSMICMAGTVSVVLLICLKPLNQALKGHFVSKKSWEACSIIDNGCHRRGVVYQRCEN